LEKEIENNETFYELVVKKAKVHEEYGEKYFVFGVKIQIQELK